ncbi:hypothetical protein K435DRAFT_960096 [Dendrothele bispora CBS 962.96]|uniref:Uncharacterized protein n=1 Tax=Dendrothele bispora (strain CBS 962.96) TaxID=1314807 RepID=A0A4S8MV68_DENBC|nr:hypothetical protein K435DRAFT_960096 [Dendrothele bispora CBS 962.96]
MASPPQLTLNTEITISYKDIFQQCMTLINQSVAVDLGFEYPNYHLWTEVATWASLVTAKLHHSTLTTAPQYNFYKAERPNTEGPPPRAVPIQTRSAGPDVQHCELPESPEYRDTVNFFLQGVLPQRQSPSDPQQLTHEAEPAAEDPANTTFGSQNNESITWRTPDGTVFRHLPLSVGLTTRPILPIILVENKALKLFEDIMMFLEAIGDEALSEERRSKLIARANRLVIGHLSQLKQQAQYVFCEYPGIEAVYGIIATGWWWRGWLLRKVEGNLEPAAEPIMKAPVPIYNDSLDGFHPELAKIWILATQMPTPEDVSKLKRSFTEEEAERGL